jgi:hypothetical protein
VRHDLIINERFLTYLSDAYTDINPQAGPSLKLQGMWRAHIFMCSDSDELGPPLPCEVCEHQPIFADLTSIGDSIPRVWETGKQTSQRDQLASCRIPDKRMPPINKLQQWAAESLSRIPSGVVAQLHGPMYTFAMLYGQSGDRPLVIRYAPTHSARKLLTSLTVYTP